MALSFYHVFNSFYLILVNNEIAGKVVFNKKNELIILDIQGWFYHEIKSILLNALLSELGLDCITLNTLTKYTEYYEELGFRIDTTIDSKSIKMIYEKKSQCMNVI